MAHKIKVKRVPHIKQDGTVGTKHDYIVRCKSRGKVCTHEKFSTRREADACVTEHWKLHNKLRAMLKQIEHSSLPKSLRVDYLRLLRPNTWAEPQGATILDATANLSTAKSQSMTGVHAA